MITRVSETDFIDAFKARKEFTHSGLMALYAYLEEDEEHELNVGDLCSEYQEFKNWAEFEDDSRYELSFFGPDFIDLENLSNHTIIIPISEEFTSMDINGIMSSNKEGFIIRSF